MENNQNEDGLDGLPINMWMGLHQQAQSQQLSTVARPVFSGSSYTQVNQSPMEREFISRQNIPTPSLRTQMAHINIQQQFQQVPPTSTHMQFNHGSQDKLALPHILSLQPPVTNSANLTTPVPSASHFQDQLMAGLFKSGPDLSHASTKGRESFLIPASPASSVSMFSQNNFSQLPFQSLPQDKFSQHLNQLMNLSESVANTTKVPLSKPLTVSTELSSLESSGDYSPVSPPANPPGYGDSLLDLIRQDKSIDFIGREPSTSGLPMTNTQPHGHTERMNSQAEFKSTLAEFTSHRTLETHSHVMPFSLPIIQKPFASPSDMPLDMTTAVAGKSEPSQIHLGKQTHNFVTSISPFEKDKVPLEKLDVGYHPDDQLCDPHSSSRFVGDGVKTIPTPFFQTPLKTSEINKVSLNPLQIPISISASAMTTVNFPQEKYIKISKSTPKKSNFYGRDVSLFTLPDATTSTISSITSTALCDVQSISPNVDSKQQSENSILEDTKNFVEATSPSFESKDSSLLCNMLTGNNLRTSDNTTLSKSEEDIASVQASLPTSIMPHHTQPFKSSDIADLNSSGSENILHNSTLALKEAQYLEKQIDTEELKHEMLEDETSLVQNIEDMQEKDINSDHLKLSTTPNSLLPKGRKRKGPGKKTKKQTPKKAKRNPSLQHVADVSPSMVVLERANTILNGGDGALPDESVKNSMNIADDIESPATKTSVKKTHKIVKDDEENGPRRSSSRKSKDNAMKLIELQADSGYVSIPGVDEEQPPKRMSRKRKLCNSAVTVKQNEPELSDLNDGTSSTDNEEKDKDDDYVVDEDEAAVIEKDELADEDSSNTKTFISKKKTGSLRISIKLSGDSSAEIVSGIEDTPVKKKRKAVKKKTSIKIPKASPKLEEKELKSKDLLPEASTKEQIDAKSNSSILNSDIQTSLIEKYFSSASASKQNLGIMSKKTLGKNVGQNSNKKVVGKNKKSRQTKRHGLGSTDTSTSISSKPESDVPVTKDNLPKFRCGYCPQRYHTKLDLLTHMDAHMSEMESKDLADSQNSFQVKEKSSALKYSSNKKQDQKLASKDKQGVLEVQKFKCGECEKVFKSKFLLLDHVRCHTEVKPFECDICHKCFADRILLSSHRKTHEQENLLRCQLCSKAFIHKADLSHHMQSHPKRTVGPTLSKKPFKTSKKGGLYKPSELPSEVTKKTSFASALSGDTDDSSVISGVPGVLVLKRKESLSLSIKTKQESVAKSMPAAQETSNIKANSSANDIAVSNVVKTGPKVLQSKKRSETVNEKNVGEVLADQIVEKLGSEAENSSGVCTCKECPECVTRFLQSFG